MWYLGQILVALGTIWLFIYLGRTGVIEPPRGQAFMPLTVGAAFLFTLAINGLVRVGRGVRRLARHKEQKEPPF
jgi:hypothetical protein